MMALQNGGLVQKKKDTTLSVSSFFCAQNTVISIKKKLSF